VDVWFHSGRHWDGGSSADVQSLAYLAWRLLRFLLRITRTTPHPWTQFPALPFIAWFKLFLADACHMHAVENHFCTLPGFVWPSCTGSSAACGLTFYQHYRSTTVRAQRRRLPSVRCLLCWLPSLPACRLRFRRHATWAGRKLYAGQPVRHYFGRVCLTTALPAFAARLAFCYPAFCLDFVRAPGSGCLVTFHRGWRDRRTVGSRCRSLV